MKKFIRQAALEIFLINMVTLLGAVLKKQYSAGLFIGTLIGLTLYHLMVMKKLSDKCYDEFHDQYNP